MSPQEFWRLFEFKARQPQGGKMPRAMFDELRKNLHDPNWGKKDANAVGR